MFRWRRECYPLVYFQSMSRSIVSSFYHASLGRMKKHHGAQNPAGNKSLQTKKHSSKLSNFKYIQTRIISYHIISYHIISYHIISYHISGATSTSKTPGEGHLLLPLHQSFLAPTHQLVAVRWVSGEPAVWSGEPPIGAGCSITTGDDMKLKVRTIAF